MALKLWLPLNGNLKNNGTANVTITNNGATVNDNGKIGKCYSFSNGGYIKGETLSIPINSWSLSAWVYPNSSSTSGHQYIVGMNTSAASDFLGVLCHHGNKFAVRTAGTTYYTDDTITLNTWYHVAATYDGTLKIYVNGSLKKTYTEVATPISATKVYVGMRGGSAGWFDGRLNDVRIYDHALSPKEVKLLSQGLVLHYPLSGGGRSNNNIITNSTGYNGISNWTGVISTNTENGKPYLIAKRIDTTSSSRTFVTKNPLITSLVNSWVAGDSFTISGYYRIPSSETYDVSANMFVRWGTSSGSSDTGFDTPSPSSATKDVWIRFEKTFTVPTSYSGGDVNFYLSAFRTGLSTVHWKNIKLEKGDHATPWCPNSADAEYTKMGFNSTIEHDISGNGYDGTKTGTFAYNSDTARHSVSTVFNGTNSYIEASESFCAGVLSYSFWVKTTTIPLTTQIIFGETSSNLAIGFYNSQIICSMGDSSVATGTAVLSGTSYTANQWNHIVVVKIGTTTRNLYVNGVLATLSSSNRWSGGKTQLIIGCRYNSGYGGYFDGQLSDFRAYATALSADDVLELYHSVKP